MICKHAIPNETGRKCKSPILNQPESEFESKNKGDKPNEVCRTCHDHYRWRKKKPRKKRKRIDLALPRSKKEGRWLAGLRCRRLGLDELGRGSCEGCELYREHECYAKTERNGNC